MRINIQQNFYNEMEEDKANKTFHLDKIYLAWKISDDS